MNGYASDLGVDCFDAHIGLYRDVLERTGQNDVVRSIVHIDRVDNGTVGSNHTDIAAVGFLNHYVGELASARNVNGICAAAPDNGVAGHIDVIKRDIARTYAFGYDQVSADLHIRERRAGRIYDHRTGDITRILFRLIYHLRNRIV